jgi:hypothetical protein
MPAPHERGAFAESGSVAVSGGSRSNLRGAPRRYLRPVPKAICFRHSAVTRAEIPSGVRHVDPRNESDAPTVTRNILSPVTPFAHVVFATVGGALAAGRLDSQDQLTFFQMAAALHQGHGDSWGEQPPIPIQRPVVPVVAAVARARGIHAAAA